MAVITISKQYASGGVELGQHLARELGCQLVGRALLGQLAQEMGVSESQAELFRRGELAWYSRVDPYLLSTVSRIAQKPQSAFNNRRYYEAVIDLVANAAESGKAVILGWGGQVILGKLPHSVHVRVVSPLAVRARRLAAMGSIPLEQARAECQRQDGFSQKFIKSYFKADWDDPLLYHLVLNMAALDFDLVKAAAAVKALL